MPFAVIPSEVEESRGQTQALRFPIRSLRMMGLTYATSKLFRLRPNEC